MARRKEPVIPDAILDQLKKVLMERALKAELDHHLVGDESGNRRNALWPQDGADRQRVIGPIHPARPDGHV